MSYFKILPFLLLTLSKSCLVAIGEGFNQPLKSGHKVNFGSSNFSNSSDLPHDSGDQPNLQNSCGGGYSTTHGADKSAHASVGVAVLPESDLKRNAILCSFSRIRDEVQSEDISASGNQPLSIYGPQIQSKGGWKNCTLYQDRDSLSASRGIEIPTWKSYAEPTVEITVEEKAMAGFQESQTIIEKLRKCVEPGRPISSEVLLAINNFVIQESTILNECLQKVIYDIQQIIYEPDGIVFSGSGKFVGIRSTEDLEGIGKIIDQFEKCIKQWKESPGDIYQDILHDKTHTSPKYLPQISYDPHWDYKLKNEPFNRDLFKLMHLCKLGNFEEAEKIVKIYEGKYPLTKDGWLKSSPEYNQYLLLRNMYQQKLDRANESGNKSLGHPNEHIFEKAESSMPSVLSNQIEALIKNHEGLLDDIQIIEGINPEEVEERISQRYDAFLKVGNSPHVQELLKHDYSLPSYSKALLKEIGIDPVKFTSCYGNVLQQVLHKEHLAIINKSADQYYQCKDDSPAIKDLVGHTLHFIEVAAEFNQAGYLEKSLTITNFCWALVDCGVGIAEGVWEAAQNAVNLAREIGQAASHPIDTATKIIDGSKILAQATKQAGKYFAKLLYYIAAVDDQDVDPWKYQQSCEKLQAHLSGAYRHIVMIENMLADKLKNAKARDYARKITSLVVEAYLVGRLTKVAATFAKSSKAKVLIQAGKIAQKTPEIVGLTAEGVPVEAAIVKRGGLDLYKTVNEKFIGSTAEVLDGTRYICAEIETLNHLKPEIEHLKILFDGTRSGFGEFAHKTIKIPYAHILGPEFNTTRRGIRLSGFHHDFNQVLEKSGIFKFTEKVIGEHGVYEAKVWYNGFAETKTFFPADWPREKVMSKILEAYDSFKASGASGVIDQGKYFVKGSTNEGISVEMYITLSGKLTTAYPTL